ncbi:MAG: phospholipase D family protein [Sedimentisphaerales bacterium]|nr:phospholipase D family protein [Sedimentisphaerales bacterium]
MGELVAGARSHLMISSPYVTRDGIAFIMGKRDPHLNSITFATDLSPANICDGATDPNALSLLMSRVPNVVLRHLPRLHAKVYVSDARCAIITSANLTRGGLERNYEYGVRIPESPVVASILQDISRYSELGALVGRDSLQVYCDIANRVRAIYQRQRDSVTRSLRSEFEKHLAAAQDQLLRLRLAEGPMHTVFAKTIRYLLTRYGPLSTEQLHPRIKAIHPDLCDDTVDRVIDGKNYGKKWKHAVRSAQQQLKKKGLIVLDDERWTLAGPT